MRGRSYKEGCTVARNDLRLLHVLHRNEKGETQLGEMVCHHSIASDLLDIFRQLYAARYTVARMVLIDDYEADDERSMTANNSSCFNFRRVAGSKVLSKHSRGLAVDINPLRNPMVKRRADGKLTVSPTAGRRWADRSPTFCPAPLTMQTWPTASSPPTASVGAETGVRSRTISTLKSENPTKKSSKL